MGLVVTAAAMIFVTNGLGAHRAVFESWGYPGLVGLYAAWLLLLAWLWSRVKYERFEKGEQ